MLEKEIEILRGNTRLEKITETDHFFQCLERAKKEVENDQLKECIDRALDIDK